MAAWTADELTRMGAAEEIQVAPQRADGSLGERVTVWIVHSGDALYVRSAVRGQSATWYRGVRQTHRGRIWVAGIQRDVDFLEADDPVNDEVDSAYRTKYRRYTGRILNSCLAPEARATTLQVIPQSRS